MKLKVNGDDFETQGDGLNITQLVDQLGLAGRPVAVEVNRRLVPKRDHDQTTLQEGDNVELVTLVGGG